MIVPGDAGRGGWRSLVEAPPPGLSGHPVTGQVTPLVTLVVGSDWHVCDQSSPARLEYLDRYFDPDHPDRARVGPVGTYRPQEFLTLQVADAFIRRANTVRHGPMWGHPVDGVVITGDVIDNGQRNELQDFVTLLVGGQLSSRDLSTWVGGHSATFDPHYWHPEAGPGDPMDRAREIFGYPSVPDILTMAGRGFETPGFEHQWMVVHGNHDALLQGTVSPSDDLNALAMGFRRIIQTAPGTPWQQIVDALRRVGPARYIHTPAFPTEAVPPDPTRHLVGAGEFRRAMHRASGAPAGHGWAGGEGSVNYFATEAGEVILVGLDTVNPHGGYEGSLDEAQLDWLDGTLALYRDRRVIVASHHPPEAMINDYAPEGAGRRILGDEILSHLHAAGNVITWLTGHEHRNALRVHIGPDGSVIPEIATASLIDWPQQGRTIEWGLDSAGRIVISSQVIDHEAPALPDNAQTDGDYLASWSRLLSVNDYQRRDPFLSVDRSWGHPSERYFTLLLPTSEGN